MIPLPAVIQNMEDRLFAIDELIRSSALAWGIECTVEIETYDPDESIPEVAYQIVNHYTKRGFVCRYDGDAGSLTISWGSPNMTHHEILATTRAYPGLIPHLGVGFEASLLYLCMTNNTDLRVNTYTTLMRSLDERIVKAAANNETSIVFGFPGVSVDMVGALYPSVIQELLDSGFVITIDDINNVYIISWGITFNSLRIFAGESIEVNLD